MVPGVRLRNRKLYKVLRDVFCKSCRGRHFRIVHYSVEGNHIHFIVEASSRAEMTCGMRRVNIRIGRRVNTALGREKGQVIADRYDERHLTSPRQARHGLAYVVNNHRHHLAERGHTQPPRFWIDPFSSAAHFHYRGRRGRPPDDEDPVAAPQSWLLRVGWQRSGSIPTDFIPAKNRK
jgi:REP element-mobilizing transposase RayT